MIHPLYRKILRFAAVCGDGIVFWFSIICMALMVTAMVSMYNTFHMVVASIEVKVSEMPIIIQEELEKTRLLYRNQAELNRELVVQQHTETKEHVEKSLAEIKSRYALKRIENAETVSKEQEKRKKNSFLGKFRSFIF